MRVAVAVSGGGDSLEALIRLREAGHDVLALHGFFLPNVDDPTPRRAAEGLTETCARLSIPLHLLDLRDQFEARVAAPFADEYLSGRTPNPCARCNAAMKFGLLLDQALALGAQCLATGHYAAGGEHPVYGWALSRGADPAKDQSYFLALTPAERLRRALFPLAATRKTLVRAELAERGVSVPLPDESQEICFVPGDDYRAFLTARAAPGSAELPGPGPAVLPDGTPVGRHQGLWRVTIGQRRGLGLSWREPLYVLDKDLATNTLMVAPRAALLAQDFHAREVNLLVDPALWPDEVLVQTRYRAKALPAWVELHGGNPHGGNPHGGDPHGGVLLVRFLEAQVRPAPGQVAVVYDAEGVVLAGGVIS